MLSYVSMQSMTLSKVMKLAKDTRKQKAYCYLRNAILSNELKQGSAIVEQDISDKLQISRTPIREALKMLEAEGLVYQIPQRGTFVKEITTQDVEEIFMLREALEVVALRESIKHISDEPLDELESKLEKLSIQSKPEDFYECDKMLHQLIIQNCGNRRLVHFLNTINSQIEMIRRISAMLPNRLEKSKQEHLRIVRALKARNLPKAESELRKHIKNVEASTLEVCRVGLWRDK